MAELSDIWRAAKPVLGAVAPVLGGLVGGPLGAAVGGVIRAGLGLPEDAPEAQVAAAVAAATPDQLIKLKQIEADFVTKMGEQGIDIERIAAGDRASARDMAIKTTIWPQGLLTAFFSLSFGVALSMLLAGLAVFPKEYELTVGTLLGALISEMKAASQFWFGTSSEGRRQADLLASAPPIDRR